MKEELVVFKNIFEQELLDEIEVLAEHASFVAGDVIMDFGQTVRQMPIITKGSVKISRQDEDGHELFLYYINLHETCAMTFTCCMMRNVSEIKAVAEDDVEMLLLPIDLMDKWMMKYTTWKSYIMRTIMLRFNELLKTIDQIAFQKLDERLIHYLLEKSKNSGSSVITLSHQMIADDLATSRVVISRLLKKLENDKKILLYRNQIKIMGLV